MGHKSVLQEAAALGRDTAPVPAAGESADRADSAVGRDAGTLERERDVFAMDEQDCCCSRGECQETHEAQAWGIDSSPEVSAYANNPQSRLRL